MAEEQKHLCKATKKDGTTCKRLPITGKEYCFAHRKKNKVYSILAVIYNFFENNKPVALVVILLGLAGSLIDIQSVIIDTDKPSVDEFIAIEIRDKYTNETLQNVVMEIESSGITDSTDKDGRIRLPLDHFSEKNIVAYFSKVGYKPLKDTLNINTLKNKNLFISLEGKFIRDFE